MHKISCSTGFRIVWVSEWGIGGLGCCMFRQGFRICIWYCVDISVDRGIGICIWFRCVALRDGEQGAHWSSSASIVHAQGQNHMWGPGSIAAAICTESGVSCGRAVSPRTSARRPSRYSFPQQVRIPFHFVPAASSEPMAPSSRFWKKIKIKIKI